VALALGLVLVVAVVAWLLRQLQRAQVSAALAEAHLQPHYQPLSIDRQSHWQ
jgi:hypothetical protein